MSKGDDALDHGLALDEYILRTWHATHGNPDPRAPGDMVLEALGKQFRKKPTLPHWMAIATRDAAFDLPDYICSFEGCNFESDLAEAFEEHICQEHRRALEPLASKPATKAKMLEAYRAGLTWACQQDAPTAHIAIDRRCLRQYRDSQSGDKIGAGICLLCARRFPYADAMGEGDCIQWKQLAGKSHFLGLSLEETKRWLGLDTYWSTYAMQHGRTVRERLRTELQDWCADVELDGQNLSIICCPEDKFCAKRCPPGRICSACQAPVCMRCWDSLRAKQASRLALANDMLVFYTPRLIYKEEVTFMELVCASPCFTAMACFSLEKKLLGDRALDQDAFMNRNRLVARGNATTFPLAWEELLQNLQVASREASAGEIRLPKVGVELAAVINVIIKAGGPLSERDDAAKIIHQARVRRAVVLQLIADAKAREHPAYNSLRMNEVVQRAEQLPEDGVPAEIVAWLPHDTDLDNVQRQKAATPTRAMLSEADVQAEFAHMCKPNAVVSERTSGGFADPNATHVAALQAAVGTAEACKAETTTAVVYTGNRLLDQFEPWYFAFAFAFLFPYGSGMPDPPSWSPKLRHRRPPDALRVEFSTWMRCMARRCESQINRDWTFGFTTWNLYFRSAINLSRNLSPYNAPIFDEAEQKFRALRAEEVEAGALQLLNALSGTYADVRGNLRPVNGDISKLSYVRNLRPAARKLLKNMKQTARSLPGTQEARRQMRFEIEAMRVRYGVPLFITVSPDEAHQWLFIRMSRTRTSDPVRSASVWQEWCSGDRQFPSLDGDLCFPIHLENFCRALPSWQQRRAVLARDPLASVDGFHVLLRLLCRHIFGVRMCELCPECDMTATPCSDTSGSNASLLGGAFGRVDAIYVTIEAQKSTGSLHGHLQCFVQCLHQHTPLTEIFQLPHWRLEALRQEYCKYQAHVAHAVYSGQGKDSIREGIEGAESTWPEHAEDAHMTTIPGYQQRRAQGARDLTEAEQWGQDYLEHDVVKLQYLKQHHYHPLNVETGERMPLRGCQKKENMGVCKSDFPRDQWLSDRAKVLCPCQLQSHGFSLTGRKNRLGALHGPYGHPYLNPCHPALLAGMRGGNNDVQVPYRLPYACATCGDSLSGKEKQLIALAAQRAQDAQTGYCSDYCSKNQPMGFHEIKEFQKGHIALHASLKQADVEHIGKRHANRFLSDAYCKGLVRGQVECCNLRANHIDGSIVAAERVSSCNFTVFPGHVYLQLLEKLDGKEAGSNIAYIRTRKAPGSGAQHMREAATGQAYSHRPSDSECWWLSPYEFTMHWELVPARIPHSRAEWEAANPDAWDVALTPVGEQKLRSSPLQAAAKLKPSTDYRLKVVRSRDRVCFASTAATAVLRHNWYLQRRVRPRCPHFANAPVPQRWTEKADRNARLTCVYFRAWTLDMTRATSQVPHLSQLLGPHETWEDALREWLLRLPCAETKRHVGNFLSVYRVRPTAEADVNSDDDGVDEPFTLRPADVAAALRTQFPAQKASSSKAANDDRANRIESAMNTADGLWQAPALLHRRPEASTRYCALDPKAIQQAARKPIDAGAVASPVPSCVAARPCPASVADVRTWAAALPHAPCNAEQRAFCELVAARVETELAASTSTAGCSLVESEPLRWVLHGGPGTGKSHTLKFLRQDLFEDVLGWHHGVDFQIVSFQAVMAELLEGDTIHHALGLDWSGDRTQSLARAMECAGRSLQWRWLILDEFSMVSAELLAQLELRCRELMRDLSLAKYDGNGKIRPFGGLNVILAGDVYQLPPPKGTFLGDIPWDLLAGRKSTRQAPGHQGQTLLWGEAAAGMQGMTELVSCERTQDAWLAELQGELRHGQLSDDNHKFLHGKPTSVPGSWIAGHATCEQPGCAALPTLGLRPEAIQEAECSYCAADRRSRILVAQGDADTRFQNEFADAVAIFGTNDIKYHVNKLRAIQWANARQKQAYLFVAQDVASSVVVQEKPNLTAEKLQWLQRHDKECGGLYGVLPLCVGMPVRATDHLDRKRGILKGTKGLVVGWSEIANETPAPEGVVCNALPAVVYVKFDTATSWQIPGMPDSNVYPVGPCRRVWYLDRQRKSPKLRVSRTQFPLAPQFAIKRMLRKGKPSKKA